MSKNVNQIFYSLAFLLILLSLAIALSPRLRQQISDKLLMQNKRRVFSVIQHDYKNKSYKIIKIQENQQLLIEIYNDKAQLINVFSLGKYLNGAIFLNGRTTELAAYDLDSDGLNEVIVPAIGKNSKSLIFIVKYQAKNDTFSLQSPISYLEQLGP